MLRRGLRTVLAANAQPKPAPRAAAKTVLKPRRSKIATTVALGLRL